MCLGRALIDNYGSFALTLMYRAGPTENSYKLQVIELGRPVIALFDLEPGDCLAISVGRQSVELAGTTIGAVAVDEFTSLDHPFGVGHHYLPRVLLAARKIAPLGCPER